MGATLKDVAWLESLFRGQSPTPFRPHPTPTLNPPNPTMPHFNLLQAPNTHIPLSTTPDSKLRQPELNQDVLLEVFYFYRLGIIDGDDWNLERWWYKPAQVCRTWRNVIHASPSRLDLHLVCSHGIPIADMLNHSPPLPLIINYLDNITINDAKSILLALKHHNRVSRISLTASATNSGKLGEAMNRNFPTLGRLRIYAKNNTRLILPTAFHAPLLYGVTLIGAAHPIGAPLLNTTTTVGLVHLVLQDIPHSSSFHPENMAIQLSSMVQLRTVTIGFRMSIPNRDVERQLLNQRMTRMRLPNLTVFRFLGVSAYLEGLLARITAPHLRNFDVRFFHQLIFSLPHLSHFVNTMQELRSHPARVYFGKNKVSVVVDHEDLHRDNNLFRIEVDCKRLDWQVYTAAQICTAAAPVLSAVQTLTLNFHNHRPPSVQRDDVIRTKWHDILMPFTGVKTLHVDTGLVGELSFALQPDDRGRFLELLPGLRELVLPLRGDDPEGFKAFISTRQATGCTTTLRFADHPNVDK